MTRITLNKLCCRAFITVSLKGSPKNRKEKKKIKEKKTGEQLSLHSNIQGNTHFYLSNGQYGNEQRKMGKFSNIGTNDLLCFLIILNFNMYNLKNKHTC